MTIDAQQARTSEYQPDMFFEKPAPTSKSLRRQANKQRRDSQKQSKASKPFEPLNDSQAEYFDLLKDPDVTQIFAIGEAGTGKTYIAARFAMRALKANAIDKIFIARPTAAPKQHKLGFLPGDMKRKLAPWLVPIIDAFKEEVSITELDKLFQLGQVEFLSFEHMRGRTFSNCFVILDEAQNCSFSDLKLFLTRKGEESIYVVAGDPTQVDIDDSGLNAILDLISDLDLSPEVVEFDAEDVVRSADAKEWVRAFSRSVEE